MRSPLICMILASTTTPSIAAALRDSVVLHRGEKVLISVLANDSGYRKPASVDIVTPPAYGSVSVDASGRVLYQHTIGTPATDTFRYSVKRNATLTYQADVTLTFTDTLRINNPALTAPSAPPVTTYSMVNAFSGNSQVIAPVSMTSPPGDTRRLFVCQKTGQVKVITNVTSRRPTVRTFLDLQSSAFRRNVTLNILGETGLLGLAFHPNYALNRQFYVAYTMVANGVTYKRLSRFTTQSRNPNAADLASELVLLQQRDENTSHNGCDLHFGPDGYLYLSLGDMGSQYDGHNVSQTITQDFFSAILRLDVDKKPGNLPPNPHPSIPTDSGVARFSVPLDNPWVHSSLGGSWNGLFNGSSVSNLNSVRTEFWAIGFRNPWRMSFDRVTGELWAGDVGQDTWEEIDLIQRGGNYGWAFREATHPGPKSPPAGFTSIDPVWEYRHGSGADLGNSVIGGVVYRGDRIGALKGSYIYGDHVIGNIWSLRRNAFGPPTVTRITGQSGISAFGTDPSNGDVLATNYNQAQILRLVANTATSTFPQTLSATGLFADLSTLSPAPGLLPYSVNLPFWSDHAIKQRWFSIPGSGKIGWSEENPWTFPAGSMWVKHFDLELTRGDPSTKKRIETRLLVRTQDGVYGVSYRWNDAGTEATLAADEGEDIDLSIIQEGSPRTQRWHIPSRSDCRSCHSEQAGYALSFNTRQLNLDGDIHGFTGNQLTLLQNAGYLSSTLPSPATLPHHVRADETTFPLEERVRSYLAVNCSYCHQSGSNTPGTWDGRAALTLAETGLINGSATNNGSDPLNRLIVPGDATHSIVLNRIATRNGFTRMPPLGSNELDHASIDLVEAWINQLNPAPAAAPVPASTITPDVKRAGDTATLDFPITAGQWFEVETSSDLTTWTHWNAAGNDGQKQGGGIVHLAGTLPPLDPLHFRVTVHGP
jgi:uncharacterized repeat protein (TIGR03806 family)